MAEDAAHRTAADIAATLDGAEYRLIGGQMVTLLVALYAPDDAPERATADAGVRIAAITAGLILKEGTSTSMVSRPRTKRLPPCRA
jgi:hypothetical protein